MMLKGIMRKRGIRKEDEVIEEMIQEEYNTKEMNKKKKGLKTL